MKGYVFEEFYSYIRQKPALLFWTILTGVLGMALSLCAGNLSKEAERQNKEYDRIYEEGQYTILGDHFYGEVEQELKAKPEYWNILKELNEMLHQSEEFEYLEIREQFSEVFDYQGGVENLKDYEYGYTTMVEHRGTEAFSNIKAIWLGEEVFEHFGLKVSEGRLFETSEYDYYFGKEKEILPPVLMGSGFRDAYQVGDIIYVNNFVMRGEVRVVGFLKEGSYTMNLATLQCLDRYLVFPMLRINDEPENGEERGLFRSLYYEKNNGLLYSCISREDMQSMVEAKCSQLGISGAYFVCGAENQPVANLGESLEDITKMIRYFAVGVLLFAVLILGLYLQRKIQQSGKYYAILFLNGFTRGNMITLILLEVFVILTGSAAGGILLGRIIVQWLFPGYQVGSIGMVSALLLSGITAVAVSLRSFWKTDISVHLK